MKHHLIDHSQSIAAVTYSSSASAVLFWGLHFSDLAVIISTITSICGVSIQFYIALNSKNKK